MFDHRDSHNNAALLSTSWIKCQLSHQGDGVIQTAHPVLTVRGVIAPCGQARTHAPQPWH